MNNLNLGFIGVGLMGLSLVKRLSYLGYKIDAYDKNLKKLEPFQKDDFKSIFKIMESRPVTIRLLDPPLHEFLPNSNEENKELLEKLNISKEELTNRIEQLNELKAHIKKYPKMYPKTAGRVK